MGGITFSWRSVERAQRNGVLLGYEVKMYSDEKVYTQTVPEYMTTFTILQESKHRFSFPNAISVAAINEVGVGNHCPPVNINQSGKRKTELTYVPSVTEPKCEYECVAVYTCN